MGSVCIGVTSEIELVHTPIHASWLNQVEIYFSIIQRKVLTPNDFAKLEKRSDPRALGVIRGVEQPHTETVRMEIYSTRHAELAKTCVAAFSGSFCCVGKRNRPTTTLFVKRTTKIGIGASELAIECLITGGDRWCRRGLVGGVGREHSRPVASGNLNEQADESVNGQFKSILLRSMFLEKFFQSLRIEERFHDATDHDAEGNCRAMGENLSRNHVEWRLSKKFLESVEQSLERLACPRASARWCSREYIREDASLPRR